ncbi:MAG: glutaredoxin 3 [Lysobacterales bacterium]
MNEVLMYTTAVCPYCIAAKQFLAQKKLAVTEIRVDIDPTRRDEMIEKTKRRTVPQIFINGQHVGGFDDMVALDRKGGVDALLKS